MPTLSLEEIYDLGKNCLLQNGSDRENAEALADTMMCAERDGSLSHGLFRLPAYVAALRSGKVNGCARPILKKITPSVLVVDGNNGFAPLGQKQGIAELIKAASTQGVAVLALRKIHHMAALWPEVEAVSKAQLVALACTAYMPAVAPAGATKALLGTNPLAFAWPRGEKAPFVFDMATASMAMGEVQIAAREGHSVPLGTGLDNTGEPTTDPKKIAQGGVLLPFGGYKGSAIALMVELLAAGLVGDYFSFEARENDNKDGGPPQGGEFILALSPEIIAGPHWQEHSESFFERLSSLPGIRMPGKRRHQNRLSTTAREINAALYEKIQGLMTGH